MNFHSAHSEAAGARIECPDRPSPFPPLPLVALLTGGWSQQHFPRVCPVQPWLGDKDMVLPGEDRQRCLQGDQYLSTSLQAAVLGQECERGLG